MIPLSPDIPPVMSCRDFVTHRLIGLCEDLTVPDTSMLPHSIAASEAVAQDPAAQVGCAASLDAKRPCPTNRRLFLQRSLSAAIAASVLGSRNGVDASNTMKTPPASDRGYFASIAEPGHPRLGKKTETT